MFLTEKGNKTLDDKGVVNQVFDKKNENSIDPALVDHNLLVNWFRIHLLQIERALPKLATEFLVENAGRQAASGEKPISLQERLPCSASEKDWTEFIPDGVFCIKSEEVKKSLLFYLEVDMGSETVASRDRNPNDVRQKILNYQALFRTGQYKRYEEVFGANLNGFRLLFLVNSPGRLATLCRLVQEMRPSDFIWLTDGEMMFSHGLSTDIWARGGQIDKPRESILGSRFSSDCPVPEGKHNSLSNKS